MRHPELAILSHHTTIFTTDKRFAVHLFPRSGVVELRIHKVNKGQIKKDFKKGKQREVKKGTRSVFSIDLHKVWVLCNKT